MTAMPSSGAGRRMLRSAVTATFVLAIAYGGQAARAGEAISVVMDQAKVVKMPESVSSVVIGNPLIADVTVQAGGIMVVTGKGYGRTNVIALDRTGNVLLDQPVEVRGPRDGVIIVYRGADRESYDCAPNCEQLITLGDNPKFFAATLNQAVTRNGQAQGATPPTR